MADTTTNPKPPSNLNVDTSVVDLLKSKGLDSSYDARTKLATGYGISNYTGTASQNMSLMGLIAKGGPKVDNTKISGSASIGMGNSVSTAVGTAATSSGLVTAPPTPQTPPPPPPLPSGTSIVGTVTNPDGSFTYTLADGTKVSTTVDPTVTTAKTDAQLQYDAQLKVQTDAINQEIAQLQEEKAKALNAANASINTAQSGLLGTEKSGYLGNIEKQYDEQIANANGKLADAKLILDTNLKTSIDTINATAQSNSRANYLTLLSSLKTGDGTALTESELGSALGTAISAGIDPTTALTEIQHTNALAKINADAKLSTQEKAQASQANTDYNNNLSTFVDVPTGDTLTNQARLGIEAHRFTADDGSYNPDAGTSKAESEVTKQIGPIVKKNQDAQKIELAQINAENRLALAQQSALDRESKMTFDQTITALKSLDPSTLASLKSDVNLAQTNDAAANRVKSQIATLAQLTGADPQTLVGALSLGLGIKPTTTTTTTSEPKLGNLWGLLPDSKTAVKTTSSGGAPASTAPASGGSSSAGSNTFSYGGVTYTY